MSDTPTHPDRPLGDPPEGFPLPVFDHLVSALIDTEARIRGNLAARRQTDGRRRMFFYLDGRADGLADALGIITGCPSSLIRAAAFDVATERAEDGLRGVEMVRTILRR